MKRTLFVLFRPLGVALALLLTVSCAPVTINLPLATPAPTGVPITVDGLTITPLPVAPDDVAEILGIYRWRFHVTAAEDVTDLRVQLLLQHPDAEPEILADFGTSDQQTIDEEMLVALYPVDGPIFQADQVQYYVRSGGTSTTGLLDNPAVDFNILQPHQPAEPTEFSTFKLLTFGQEFSGDAVETLLLRVSSSSE